MSAPPPEKRLHLVVLGAGFAGLNFCQSLPRNRFRVTLVDRQNHHLFQPLLYQVATAGLSASAIAQPVRSILRGRTDITIRMNEVRGINLAEGRVQLAQGELSYDRLVIALGGQNSYFGHDKEWARHAPGLKSLDDALGIRRRVLTAFERAETETDPDRRRELMTIVLVGAGPTGVELAGTFAELCRRVLRRDFTHIDPAEARVLLIEAGPRVLPSFTESLSASAKRQLESLGVEVWLDTPVKDLRRNEVETAKGTLRAANIIWAAGVGAAAVTRHLDVETDRAGRIKVEPDLSLPGHPHVFALGDLVALRDAADQPVPGVAPAAMQMGRYLARQLARADGGRPSKPFRYVDKGNLATIGRSAAVAQVGKLRFSGSPAWLAWLGVHLVFLVGFRNRVAVLFSWMYSYFTYKRGARIILASGTRAPDSGAPPDDG